MVQLFRTKTRRIVKHMYHTCDSEYNSANKFDVIGNAKRFKKKMGDDR